MATTTKGKVRRQLLSEVDRAVAYRGIKIPPMTGRRSPLAREIREALANKIELSPDEPAGV